jgi:hypothetical protein
MTVPVPAKKGLDADKKQKNALPPLLMEALRQELAALRSTVVTVDGALVSGIYVFSYCYIRAGRTALNCCNG